MVDAEILRVLKPGGSFIAIDTLNHNPIYRFNRWIHYLRGYRTGSTLKRMPTIKRIDKICQNFKQSEVRYCGAIIFLMPLVSFMFGADSAQRISVIVDSAFGVKKSAFKFVLSAKGLQK